MPLVQVAVLRQLTHDEPLIPQAVAVSPRLHVASEQHPGQVTGHSPPQPLPPPHGLLAQLGVQTHW
jgi:hypothetical protein